MAPVDPSVTLLGWLDAADTTRGLYVLDREDWCWHSYAELSQRVFGATEVLESHDLAGETIAVLADDPLQFGGAFFAALNVGATPLPIAPPVLMSRDRYISYLVPIIRAARPRLIVAGTSLRPILVEAVVAAGATADVIAETPSTGEHHVGSAPEIALLQLTSGSSRVPRPVRISGRALEANISAIRTWLNWQHDDVLSAWLPLFHDLGLIGGFLNAVLNQTTTYLMKPSQFLRRPLRWIQSLSIGGATITAATNLGYAHVARRVSVEDLQGLDFSQLRVAGVGAEPIDARALSSFARLLKPFGFSEVAFRPAYGLAEATLAVTGHSLGSAPRVIEVDRAQLQLGSPVKWGDGGRIGSAVPTPSSVVSSGRPLQGVTVTVVGSDGNTLEDGVLGEIVVDSPSLMETNATELSAARTDTDEDATHVLDGHLRTRDAGFTLDGEYFIVGRMADSVKRHGRHIYAESVETAIREKLGDTVGRIAMIPDTTGEGVVIVVERGRADWAVVEAAARSVVGAETPITILAAARGSIEVTTSGKPRRRLVWQAHRGGSLSAEVVWSSVGQPGT